MAETISIRMTPERARLFNRARKKFRLKRYSEVVDLALQNVLKDEVDYAEKLESVSGCVSLEADKDSVQAIRHLRNGK